MVLRTMSEGSMNYVLRLIFCVVVSQGVLSKKHGAVNHDERIVGGNNATSAEMYPYQAYLLLQKESNYYQCGGSIISDRAVVTAAHCMKGTLKAFIRIGSIYANSGGLQYQSADFRIHPLYNNRTIDYDIAVIRLAQPMKLDGKNAKAIALPKNNAAIPEGTMLTATDWGITDKGAISNTLMTVDIPALTNERCNTKLTNITPRMVCAGEEQGGKSICMGDSGGPAVDKNSKTLLGVSSFIVGGCGKPGLPMVFARVPALTKWIQENARP